MISIYQSDVTKLSDAELKFLMDEIEEAGVLYDDEDGWEYDAGSWDQQAHDRYYELHREANRRWELANPEAAAKRRSITPLMAATMAGMQKSIAKLFDNHFHYDLTNGIAPISERDFRIPFSVNQ